MTDDPEAELRRLRSELDSLRRRVEELEETVDTDSPTARRDTDPSSKQRDGNEAGVEPSGTQTAEGGDAVVSSEADSETGEKITTGGEKATRSEPSSSSKPRSRADAGRGGDWERNVGIKWLGLIGGVALVVGVVFFVRLAIDIGLLGPLGRVAVGTLGGLVLLGGGRVAAERRGYRRWGRITAGIGLAITYFSAYAAYGFETYRTAIGTPLWGVVLALSALVAVTAVVSVRDGAPVIAGETILLGYVTAYLGLESASFLVTPAYALLLAGGLVAIASLRTWSRLVAASVIPTYGLLWIWIVDVDPGVALVTGVVLLAFGLYLTASYVLRASDRADRWHSIQTGALTALNAGVAAIVLEITTREWFSIVSSEGFAVAGIGIALAGFYALTDRQPVRRDDVAGVLAAVLFGGSIVLAFGVFAATVGLLAVVCVSVAASSAFEADAVRTGGHLVAGGVAYKLLVVDSTALPAFDAAEPMATVTGRATAYVLAIAVFYGLAWWLSERAEPSGVLESDFPVAGSYAVAGTGLAVVLLWLELSGLGVSVAWAVFGLVLVGIGLGRGVRPVRYQGIAVLGLATLKVFLYDTQDLDTFARTLSFLVLGGILLAASYAYARWQGEEPLSRLIDE